MRLWWGESKIQIKIETQICRNKYNRMILMKIHSQQASNVKDDREWFEIDFFVLRQKIIAK